MSTPQIFYCPFVNDCAFQIEFGLHPRGPGLIFYKYLISSSGIASPLYFSPLNSFEYAMSLSISCCRVFLLLPDLVANPYHGVLFYCDSLLYISKPVLVYLQFFSVQYVQSYLLLLFADCGVIIRIKNSTSIPLLMQNSFTCLLLNSLPASSTNVLNLSSS